MRTVHRSLVFVLLLVVFSFAPAAFTDTDTAPWLRVDTRGEDAVVLEFLRDGDPVSKILLRQGNLGSIRVAEESDVIGVVVESISDRGDRARLGVYRLEDQYTAELPRSENWLEDVELAKGALPIAPEKTALYTGDTNLTMRLVDTILVTR